MIKLIILGSLVSVLLAATPLPPSSLDDCTGCAQDDETWGGGSADVLFTFVPDGSNAPGVCYPNCTWEGCHFSGTLKVKNKTGGPIEVMDFQGNPLHTVENLQTQDVTISVDTGCGEAPIPSISVHSGGAEIAAYKFGCAICN